MSHKKLILGSQSPRRQELLSKLTPHFSICPALAEEIMDPSLSPTQLVEHLALQKAQEVFGLHPDAVVIGADTVVVFQDTIFGKPKNPQHAIEMLSSLQGNTHLVCTGLAIISEKNLFKTVKTSRVIMKPLSIPEVEDYVATGSPLDKAGAYGIQDKKHWITVEQEEDYTNIMGFPLDVLREALPSFGIPLLEA